MDFRQKMAIINSYKKIIKQLYPKCPDACGIYILTRAENGFRYAYIGQAKKILTRLAQHFTGHQHIDLSLKNHKFYCENNSTGWKIEWFLCEEKDLDRLEQDYILKYHKKGYQMRNKTAGGQGVGKFEIAETRPKKGYYDGVAYGEKKTKLKVNEFFEKYLEYSIKEPKNKIKERKFAEFGEFLKGGKKLTREGKINKYADVLNIERVEHCAKEFIRYELSLKEVDESKRHHVIALLYDDGFVDYMLTNTAESHEEIMDIPLDEYKKLATIIEEINKD